MKLLPGLCAGALAFTLLACNGSGGDTPQGPETAEERSFPTFEPFLASRMANFVFAATLPGSQDGGLEEFVKTGEVFRIEQAPIGTDKTGDDALLELTTLERSWAVMVPVAISKLEPLWKRTRAGTPWSQQDFELASTVLELLNRAPQSWVPLDGPMFEFGRDKQNAASLDAMLNWFEARAQEPACMGAMIATMDDGPWNAPDLNRISSSTVMDSRHVGGGIDVRILLIEQDSPWCLQAVRNGETLWTKHLDRVPPGSLTFTEKPPTRLGPYGVKLHLSFGEYCHVYLGPEGEFLFYFASW